MQNFIRLVKDPFKLENNSKELQNTKSWKKKYKALEHTPRRSRIIVDLDLSCAFPGGRGILSHDISRWVSVSNARGRATRQNSSQLFPRYEMTEQTSGEDQNFRFPGHKFNDTRRISRADYQASLKFNQDRGSRRFALT